MLAAEAIVVVYPQIFGYWELSWLDMAQAQDIPRSQKQHFQNTGFWGKERLTASERTFAVPVAIEKGNTLTVGEGSPLNRMKIYSTPGVAATNVAAQSCKDVSRKRSRG